MSVDNVNMYNLLKYIYSVWHTNRDGNDIRINIIIFLLLGVKYVAQTVKVMAIISSFAGGGRPQVPSVLYYRH